MEQKILSLFKNTTDSFSEAELLKILKIDDDKSYHRFQSALKSLIDNYQLVISRKQRYLLAVSANLYVGEIDIKEAGYGFVDFKDYPSLYIGKRHLKDAMPKDLVVVKKKPHLNEAEVIQILRRNLTHLVGTISFKKKHMTFTSDQNTNGKVINIKNPHNFALQSGDKVVLKITNFGKNLQAEVESRLGKANDPHLDIISVLVAKQIEYQFNQEVLTEVSEIPQMVENDQLLERENLTDLLTVSIDGADAKDLDDAISISKEDFGYRLYVHIADVSEYVKPKTAIDKTAHHRTASLYPLDYVVPMLPAELSNGICSLLPNQKRLTLTCKIEIDFKGDVINYQFMPAVISSDAKLTYQLVEDVLFKKDKLSEVNDEIVELLNHALELSNIIRQKQRRQGYLEFFSNESQYEFTKKGVIKSIRARKDLNSEKIIEDFMILANRCAADFLISNELPGIYRIHEKPEREKVLEMIELIRYLDSSFPVSSSRNLNKQLQSALRYFSETKLFYVVSNLLLRSLPKAYYDSVNKGHFGLGLKAYSHFTAPIRRYPDLIVHRIIKTKLMRTKTKIGDLNEISKHVSKQERLMLEVEREIEAMKKAEYMEQHIGESYLGTIVSFTEFGFFVRLENSIEGLVHYDRLKDDHYVKSENQVFAIGLTTQKTYQIGQEVEVEVIGANKDKRQIDFTLL